VIRQALHPPPSQHQKSIAWANRVEGLVKSFIL
jgi:hypothetical protein